VAKPSEYYDEEYYDTNPLKGYPGTYDMGCAPWERLARAITLSFGPTIGASSIMDIGCGRGFTLWWLKQKGWEVWGCDFSEYAVKTALLPIHRLDVVTDVIDEQADIVMCVDVLEHIDMEDLPAALANIRTSMRMAAIIQTFIPGVDKNVVGKHADDHVTIMDKDSWQRLFEANGFRRHALEPYYLSNLGRLGHGQQLTEIWRHSSFVLEVV